MRWSKPRSDGSGWEESRKQYRPGPSPDGALRIVSVSGHWLQLQAADGARVGYNWNTHSFSKRQTCAPRRAPWSSAGCPESVWVRGVVAAAGGRILGVTQGIEPQRNSAFLVELNGHRFSFGAISKESMGRMGGYFSMGEFGAGMGQSGSVHGVTLFGDRKTEHWSWDIHGYSAEIHGSDMDRSTVAGLLKVSTGVS
jgi:hypothetical protein